MKTNELIITFKWLSRNNRRNIKKNKKRQREYMVNNVTS